MAIFELAAAAALGLFTQDPAFASTGNGQERVSPRGSYRDSCQNDYVNRGRLYADCRDSRGRYRGTSIELSRCGPYDVANNDGRLVCGPHRGDYEDRPGDGGWDRPDRPDRPGGGGGRRGAITVYADSNFRGASMTFRDEIPNLANSGLNDRISSMEVRGEWEACTDAYFRGYCQRFTGSVRNLGSSGMNDRISSLRPVGRGGGWGGGWGGRGW